MTQQNILTHNYSIKKLDSYCRMFNVVVDLELSVSSICLVVINKNDDYAVRHAHTLTPPNDTYRRFGLNHIIRGDKHGIF